MYVIEALLKPLPPNVSSPATLRQGVARLQCQRASDRRSVRALRRPLTSLPRRLSRSLSVSRRRGLLMRPPPLRCRAASAAAPARSRSRPMRQPRRRRPRRRPSAGAAGRARPAPAARPLRPHRWPRRGRRPARARCGAGPAWACRRRRLPTGGCPAPGTWTRSRPSPGARRRAASSCRTHPELSGRRLHDAHRLSCIWVVAA